jgi:3',5'-nucleoside bisphosphate phosphatase
MSRAAAAGVDVVALTDHDTVAGITQAACALPPGLTLLPGMELSCRRDGHSVHLLAYLFDPLYPELAVQCQAIRDARVDRARAMVARLAELGAPVSWDQVTAIAGDGVIGRPHIARAMVQSGVVESAEQAFTADWIGTGGRAFVRRYALDPADAIALVHAAGGATVLAHPLAVTRGWAIPEQLIVELAAAGLDGVEVAHPDHDQLQRDYLRAVAARLDLAATGGSDDHGELTGDRIGCEWTDADDLEQLLAAASGTPVITG